MKQASVILSIITVLMTSISVQATDRVNTILFGSCVHQDKEAPILNAIIQEPGDLFIFLGDNVYGDTEDMQLLADKYQRLGTKPAFNLLRKMMPTIAIWDDHDYGENDAGKHYPKKQQSKQIMLDFWNEPKDSIRRTQSNGIFTAYTYGQGDQLVRVILPDLRWNRDELQSVNRFTNLTDRLPKKMGPYMKHEDADMSMLGEQQWLWLEQELRKPAAIRILASSLQMVADFTGWEAWANFPHDRQRLLNIIKQHKLNGVLVISGDTHWGELSKLNDGLDYPLYDLTSSGLTEKWKHVSPNQHRVGDYFNQVNYGFIDIDWQQIDPSIHMGLKGQSGDILFEQTISLSSISPYN